MLQVEPRTYYKLVGLLKFVMDKKKQNISISRHTFHFPGLILGLEEVVIQKVEKQNDNWIAKPLALVVIF